MCQWGHLCGWRGQLHLPVPPAVCGYAGFDVCGEVRARSCGQRAGALLQCLQEVSAGSSTRSTVGAASFLPLPRSFPRKGLRAAGGLLFARFEPVSARRPVRGHPGWAQVSVAHFQSQGRERLPGLLPSTPPPSHPISSPVQWAGSQPCRAPASQYEAGSWGQLFGQTDLRAEWMA